MGNQSSGIVPEIHRKIKDQSIFQSFLLTGGNNISIDMAVEGRVQDPYNLNFEIMWATRNHIKGPTDVILLFPHYDEMDKSVLHTGKYISNRKLQQEINSRLKNDQEKDPSLRDNNQIVLCWGDKCYKISGLSKAKNVYLLWSKEAKAISNSSAGTNQLFGECPVIVSTDGHYKPINIFPVHPGRVIDASFQAPRTIDPSKVKHFWHEDKPLFILDKREPEKPGPKIIAHTELSVQKKVGEIVTIVHTFESEDDEFFGEIGSESSEEDEKGRKEPPFKLVSADILLNDLTIRFNESDDGESQKRKKVKKRLSTPKNNQPRHLDFRSEGGGGGGGGGTRKREAKNKPKVGGSLRGRPTLSESEDDCGQAFITTSDEESIDQVPLELIPTKSVDSEDSNTFHPTTTTTTTTTTQERLKHTSWKARNASKMAKKKLRKKKKEKEKGKERRQTTNN